jgi:hypothetical protein
MDFKNKIEILWQEKAPAFFFTLSEIKLHTMLEEIVDQWK